MSPIHDCSLRKNVPHPPDCDVVALNRGIEPSPSGLDTNSHSQCNLI